MKQQLLSKRWFFSLLLTLVTTLSRAYDFEVDGIYYNRNDDGTTVSVSSGGKKYSGDVIIPTTVTYDVVYDVTSIGNEAFWGCSELTSVIVGNNVTSIGRYAFSGCSSLTSITIGNSVASILTGAFGQCTKLTSVTINSDALMQYTTFTMQSLAAFFGSKVREYIIGNNVTSIGSYAFQYCYGLTEITIPTCVTSIGDFAFRGCSSLTSITIPNNVTAIGNSAFDGCTSLPVIDNIRYADTYLVGTVDNTQSIYNIKNGTRFLGSYAFMNCSGLSFITIPESVTNIGDGAFELCSGLTSITIPNSVTSIGGSVFRGCSNLKSVTIPNSVTSIGNYTFCDCSCLTSITIPESVTTIGDYAFDSCSGLMSITIPNSVTSIGSYAFVNCSGLTEITIPNSVTSIGSFAFDSCSGLKSVTCFAESVPVGNNIFYRADAKEVLYVPVSALNAYKNAQGWRDFNKIIGIYPSAVGDLKVATPKQKSTENAPIYDLMGHRLSERPTRGMYIQNGKKFFAK